MFVISRYGEISITKKSCGLKLYKYTFQEDSESANIEKLSKLPPNEAAAVLPTPLV